MDVDRVERYFAHEVKPEHHHARHPEKDDVEAGDQHIGWVITCQLGCLLGPAQGRERPQPRGEPGVQHVGLAFQLGRLAVVLGGGGLGFLLRKLHENMAIGAVPGGNLVTPPELSRDAPGLDVAHPLEIGVLPLPGHEPGLAALDRRDRRAGQGGRVGEPLVGKPGLDGDARAIAVRHHVELLLDLLQQAPLVHFGDDLLACFVAVEAAKALGCRVVDVGVLIENIDQLEVVAAADLEVVEVVGRCHLDRARALLWVGIVVGDDDQAALGRGLDAELADQCGIALVVRMDRHGGVSKHCLRPGRGDGNVFVVKPFYRVLEVPQMALRLALFDLEIGDCGVQLTIPVDQSLVAIDQALLVEVDEDLAHRRRQALVHGEALARPVRRGAEAAELIGDGAAGFLFPGPDSLDKAFAAEVVAGLAFFGKLAFDHHLGGDTGMIGTRLPQGIAAAHALPADQDVLQSVVEGVAHVQAAGNVGRRNHDGVRVGVAAPAAGEGASLLPGVIVARLGGLVPVGLVQHRRWVFRGPI